MAERFYYAGDEKIPLTPSQAFVAVKVAPEVNKEALVATAREMEGARGLSPEAGEVIEPFDVVLLPAAADATEDALSRSASTLASAPNVEGVLPVFQIPEGDSDEVMILIPQIRVQFKPDVSQETIDEFNSQYDVEVVAKDDLGPNSYLLRLKPDSELDALDLANRYHESDLTEYAEPDWLMKVKKPGTPGTFDHIEQVLEPKPDQVKTNAADAAKTLGSEDGQPQVGPMAPPVNDPHYPDQWALAKMNVPQAWGISRGRSTIKIAIIDEGVQTAHLDLSAKIVTPYDAVGNDNNQEPNSWDGHGTACAGIAAAIANNGRGVAGVAPECKILPVRIAYSSSPGANWTTNTTWIARGIRTAVDRGADVLSNSWGGGPYSAAIRSAFQYARSSGRGGKGCVVIAATGNNDQHSVSYPAKYPEVLGCGASNEWDQRKSRTSQDGENWWGSNYGPEVDFLAPGVHIYTTDISGTGGYGSGDYYHRFNGTSSATPNAAGVAALVLSVDPNLRQWEVRDILRLTAQDLGGRGQDDEHGWGRLNAFKALQAASRVWYEVRLRLEFLGSGQECYMRFQSFRIYNSGLNRIRINNFNIRSFDPSGAQIDRFDYQTTAGGIMQPGLTPGGGTAPDVQARGVLLKASGNRQKWNYRWSANWGYTYWRPSGASTSPAMAAAAEAEEEVEQEFQISVESPEEGERNPQITVEKSFLQGAPTLGSEPIVVSGDGRPVTVTIKIG